MALRLVLCLACLVPAAARAGCPTAADMAGGIEVSFANGDITVMRDVGAGMVEVGEVYAWAPQGRRYFAWLGLYVTGEGPLLAAGQSDPAAEVRTIYPGQVTAMPVPAGDAPDWNGQVRRELGTGDIETPDYHVRFAAMDPVTIGDCTYDAIAVGESLRPGTPEQKDQYSWYLPALGTGFILGWTIGGELVRTEAVAIRALARTEAVAIRALARKGTE